MKISVSYLKDKRICWFITLCLLVFCFVTKSESTTNYGVIIPFIKYNSLILLLAIIMMFVMLIFISNSRHIKFDIIAMVLLARCLLNLVPLIYIDVPDSYLGNYVSSWVPFLFYFILLNSKVNYEKTCKTLIFFGCIISLQCFLAYYLITSGGIASYFDLWYKSYFVIPIGATNHIACVLIPLLIIGNRNISGKRRILYDVLLIMAIISTKSRGGVCLAILYYFIELFLSSTNRKRKLFITIAFIPLFIFGLLLPSDDYSMIQVFFSGYSSGGSSINSLLTGRLALFKEFFTYIGNHLLFGNGVSYDQLGAASKGTHNAILTILYENGFMGFLIYSVFAFTVIARIKSYKESSTDSDKFFSKTPAIVILFIFLNSMFEPCLFTLSVDLIFLIMIRFLSLDTFTK